MGHNTIYDSQQEFSSWAFRQHKIVQG